MRIKLATASVLITASLFVGCGDDVDEPAVDSVATDPGTAAETEMPDATAPSDETHGGNTPATEKPHGGDADTEASGAAAQIDLGAPEEFDLVPTSPTIAAGTVNFSIKNRGAVEHEVVFIRTDLDSGDLPPDGSGGASEEGAITPKGDAHGDGLEEGHVGTHFAAGTEGMLTVNLKPGRYAVVCNIPGHYAAGMHTNIEVTKG